MTVKSRESVRDSRVAKFYRNFGVCLAVLVSEYTDGNSPNGRQMSRALINSGMNIRIDDQRRKKDIENETRHRIEMQWERGRIYD